MRGSIVVGLFALAISCGGVPKASTPNDAVKVSLPSTHYALPNGLEVVLQEDHHSPFVAVRMRYHTGAKDDPERLGGLAHLVEHMTFAEGAHIGKDALLSAWADLGATEYNGTTWLDETDYYVTLPSSQLASALWIESERMTQVVPALTDATLQREINVVDSERREHYANVPYGFLQLFVHNALFPPTHPYHHAPIGDIDEFGHAKVSDIRAFLERNYVPDNATLVLVGDFESAKARVLVEKYFASTPPGKERPAPRVVPTPTGPFKHEIVTEANVPYPLLVVAWLGPPPGKPGAREAEYAIATIAGTIGGRITEKHSARGATYGAHGGRLGSIYQIILTGEHGQTMKDLSSEVRYAIEQRKEWTAQMDGRKSGDIAQVIYDFENLTTRARSVEDGLSQLGTPDYAQPTIEDIRTVTPVAVRSAVEDLFAPDRAAFVWVEPNQGAPASGRIVR